MNISAIPWFQSSNNDSGRPSNTTRVVPITARQKPPRELDITLSEGWILLKKWSIFLVVAESVRARAQIALNFKSQAQLVHRSISQFVFNPEVDGEAPDAILLDMSPAYYNNYPSVRAVVDRVRESSDAQLFALAHRTAVDVRADSYDQRLAKRHGLHGVLPGKASRENLLASFAIISDQLSSIHPAWLTHSGGMITLSMDGSSTRTPSKRIA
jgi:hypothetical protein